MGGLTFQCASTHLGLLTIGRPGSVRIPEGSLTLLGRRSVLEALVVLASSLIICLNIKMADERQNPIRRVAGLISERRRERKRERERISR